MAEKKTNAQVNIEELRAQIEAEIRAELEAEAAAKVQKEDEDLKYLVERIKKHEQSLEAQAREQEKTIKQQLDSMKKVWIEIPEDPNNPDDVVPVGWQGIIYAIPRGQQFEVPEVIYQVWKESYEKTKEVNRRIRESVTKEITVL